MIQSTRFYCPRCRHVISLSPKTGDTEGSRGGGRIPVPAIPLTNCAVCGQYLFGFPSVAAEEPAPVAGECR